jgi:phosphate transport system substrate-binding protein
MNNKAYQKAHVKVINALMLLLSMLFLMNCSERKGRDSARSGVMTLAVDRQLGDIASSQLETFTRYYPDAIIKLQLSGSDKTIKHLLDHNARAALISGEPEAVEDSLFATMHRPFRREPVARDAIVCIVNRLNPLSKLSMKELKSLFSGKENNGVTPLVTADDYRLQSVFAAAVGMRKKEIRASCCRSEKELIHRVSTDNKAIGLLFRSSLDGALKADKAYKDVRVIPLARESVGSLPIEPTQQNIFEGRYPLVTTVYYVYYAGDALAAGFGSWLSTTGQKAFEKSSLAPYRAFERTIILK